MDKMAQTFQQAAQQLQETQQQMGKMAQMMGDGALNGTGGTMFVDAINNKLNKRLKVLEAKMKELQKDIKSAQQANREAEGQARGRFQN
jgi:uncharacterized protein YukE